MVADRALARRARRACSRCAAGASRRRKAPSDLDEVLAGVRLIRRTNVLLGAISLDLFAVLLGGAVALLPIFAKDILEVGPDRARAPARRSRGRLVRRGARASPATRSGGEPGPTLFVVVAGFGVVHGRLRALARDVALDARARARRRLRHRERRPALDDPPARHARRAARARERRRDGLHQRVERARRVRVGRRGGAHRRRAGGRGRRAWRRSSSQASGGSSSRRSLASTGWTSFGRSRVETGSDGREAARLAARGGLAALRGELDLPQADVRRHLDALVLADVLERLVERQRRGGISRTVSSASTARMFVSFFSFVAFTSRSSARAFSPTIIPS